MQNVNVKTISMAYTEYQVDLQNAETKGYGSCLATMRHVLDGKIVKRGEGTTDEEWKIWSDLMERLKSEKST
jgi:polyhydroxyalkanoate synthesis regulator phasin